MVFVSCLAVALARPGIFYSAQPYYHTAYAAPIAIHAHPAITQYHSQDTLGQYSYGKCNTVIFFKRFL